MRLRCLVTVLALLLVSARAWADSNYYDVAFSQAATESFARPLANAAVTVRKNAICLGGAVACGNVADTAVTDSRGNWDVTLPESDFYDIEVAGGQTQLNIFIATSAIGTAGAPDDASYVTTSAEGSLSDESVLTQGTGITVTVGGGLATVASTLGVDVDLSGAEATGIAPLTRGGTNKGTGWTAGRCVRVNDTGDGLEPAAEDCFETTTWRCVGGANDGVACSDSSECPGGSCSIIMGSGLKFDGPAGDPLESESLTQITVTTSDTTGIFAESGDILTIDPAKNWPRANTATALHADPADCTTGPQKYATGINASGTLTCAQVATSQLSGVLPLASGGTGLGSGWTADDCVKVNAAGTALEPAGAACGTGGGGTLNVKENGTSVVAAATALNFSNKFDVTDALGNQANVTVANDGIVLGTDTSGTLPVSEGGTGATSFTASRCVETNPDGDGFVSSSGPCQSTFPRVECLQLDITAGVPGATGGCTKTNVAGSNFGYQACSFQYDADNTIDWSFQLPKNLTGTSAQIRFMWLTNDAACDGGALADACWAVDSASAANGAQWHTAALAGTALGVTSRCQTSGYLVITAETGFTHAWTAGKQAVVHVWRDVDGGTAGCGGSTGDDLVAPALLRTVELCYQVSSAFSGEP